jgi:hypothetical protein
MLKRLGQQKRQQARLQAKREIPQLGDPILVTEDDGTKVHAIIVRLPRYDPPRTGVLGRYTVNADEVKLTVNKAKSAVAAPQVRKFLGFSLTSGTNTKRRLAPQTVARFKARVQELTRRTRGRSLAQIVKELSVSGGGPWTR